jgi:hypothetical protein
LKESVALIFLVFTRKHRAFTEFEECECAAVIVARKFEMLSLGRPTLLEVKRVRDDVLRGFTYILDRDAAGGATRPGGHRKGNDQERSNYKVLPHVVPL